MDDCYAIFIAPDLEDDEVLIYDTGTKEAMNSAFEKLVTDGEEDGNIYLCRVIKSAEIVEAGTLEVLNHGDEDESNS